LFFVFEAAPLHQIHKEQPAENLRIGSNVYLSPCCQI